MSKPKTDATYEQAGPMQDYDVHCCHCGEDFSISRLPDWCPNCGTELKVVKKGRYL